jgi:hypothetical protein
MKTEPPEPPPLPHWYVPVIELPLAPDTSIVPFSTSTPGAAIVTAAPPAPPAFVPHAPPEPRSVGA